MAEGSLGEVQNMLVRGKELAVQAANDINVDSDGEQIEKEFNQLIEEIKRFGRDAEFNIMKLFDGSTPQLTLQLGANQGTTQTIIFKEISVDTLNLDQTSIAKRSDAEKAITSLDNASKEIFSQRSQLGAWTNGLDYTDFNLEQKKDNISSANSVIRDANTSTEIMSLTKQEILRDTRQSTLNHSSVQNNQVLNLLN